MKRSSAFIFAAALAACLLLFAACRTDRTAAVPTPAPTATPEPGTPQPEPTIVPATPTPAPVLSLSVTEKTDAAALSETLSALPSLETVVIEPGMLENAGIAALCEAFPNITFRYAVAVGAQFVPPAVTELTADGSEGSFTAEEIADALPYLPSLETVRLGLRTPEELSGILPLLSGPETDYTVSIYGLSVAPDAESLDLSETESPSPETLKSALPYLRALKTVELGERDVALADAFRAVDESIAVSCRFSFVYQDRELTESTETLDLTKVKITDVDELKLVLKRLPALTHVEMVGCGLDNETMAALRDEFPEKGIVWEISLGFWGRVRTDATAFTTRSSKSDDEMKHRLTTETLQPLQYCTELVALDLGHQRIEDISCLKSLTKLQILILADNRISDITPLASMPDLVYVELFMNRISDVSPLSGLTKLKDLNICTNYISDLTPLYSLTSLERLWYSNNKFTVEDHNALQERLPNCICDRTVWQETEHGWREHERYFWMRSFFRDCPRYK